MAELFLIFLCASGGAFWLAMRRRADLARQVCRQVCRQHGVQLLDDSVAFRRTLHHRGQALRSYGFEWSRDGSTRQRGTVWLERERVEYLSFEEDGRKSTLVNAPAGLQLEG